MTEQITLEQRARAYLTRRDSRFERESYMPECYDELLVLLKTVAQQTVPEEEAQLQILHSIERLEQMGGLLPAHEKELLIMRKILAGQRNAAAPPVKGTQPKCPLCGKDWGCCQYTSGRDIPVEGQGTSEAGKGEERG